MSKTKVLTIIGARPQFIKAAVVSNQINKRKDIEEILIHTGQHFDANMSDVFFEQMGMPKPKYHLNHGSLTHGAMTGRMIEEIEKIVLEENPNWILVYGDTNSTLAGAIVASKLEVKLAHVEAGLRSYNMQMPEEVNRILTDRVSDVLFCTSETAIENLNKEGYQALDNKIINVGDVMYDAALIYGKMAQKPKEISILKEFVLATIHRPINTDNREKLTEIIAAFNEINEKTPLILTVHPRTKKRIQEYKLKPDFTIIDPVGFLEMIHLLKNAKIVLTDSGGLQKETFFHKKPCVTLRDETEWTELIDLEANMLCSIKRKDILAAFNSMLNKNNINYEVQPYGDGKAGEKIVEALISEIK